MREHDVIPLTILLMGAVVVLSVAVKALFERMHAPALVGFMLLGLGLRALGDHAGVLGPEAEKILEFLAELGVICLLFRVGLESDLEGLLGQLRAAVPIWACNVLVSGALPFAAAYGPLELGLVPSLFVGVAMSATSVGVAVAVWRQHGRLETATGETLVDVAELDDVSGIVLMALLFSVATKLHGGGAPAGEVFGRLGWVLGKLLAFGLLCWLYSRYLEEPVTRLSQRIEPKPDPMIVMVGVALLMAALAALLGFSVAIGAFFAGLVFSRDPEAVKMEASFEALYELFYPFFFLGIGLKMAPAELGETASLGLALLGLAVAGKLVGTALPAWPTRGWWPAALLSVSMVPRAEIAMIVMTRGHAMGAWAVPDRLYSAMVLVSAVTCVAAPVLLDAMLRRDAEAAAAETGSTGGTGSDEDSGGTASAGSSGTPDA